MKERRQPALTEAKEVEIKILVNLDIYEMQTDKPSYDEANLNHDMDEPDLEVAERAEFFEKQKAWAGERRQLTAFVVQMVSSLREPRTRRASGSGEKRSPWKGSALAREFLQRCMPKTTSGMH